MLKLLRDQGKCKSLWKRNMLKFTAIYLYPSFQISPSYWDMTPLHHCPYSSLPDRTSVSCFHSHGTVNVMVDAQMRRILLQGLYKKQKSSLPSTESLITNLHESNKNFLAFKPSIKLATVKLFSKLWSTCSCFVSTLEKYLVHYSNRDKFLKSSLERQLSTLWCSWQKIYGVASWRFLKPESWTLAVD